MVMNDKDIRDQFDLLRHIERLTEEINRQMAARNRSVIKRYPLSFALVALVGIVAVSEGIKGMLEGVEYFSMHPSALFLVGLLILVVLGAVYQKIR